MYKIYFWHDLFFVVFFFSKFTWWLHCLSYYCIWKWHDNCFFRKCMRPIWIQILYFYELDTYIFNCTFTRFLLFIISDILICHWPSYLYNSSCRFRITVTIWWFSLCHFHCCQFQTSNTCCCLFLWRLVSRLGDGCLWI